MSEEYQITSSIEVTASIDLSKILEILNVPYSDLILSSLETGSNETETETTSSEDTSPKTIEFVPIKGTIVDS